MSARNFIGRCVGQSSKLKSSPPCTAASERQCGATWSHGSKSGHLRLILPKATQLQAWEGVQGLGLWGFGFRGIALQQSSVLKRVFLGLEHVWDSQASSSRWLPASRACTRRWLLLSSLAGSGQRRRAEHDNDMCGLYGASRELGGRAYRLGGAFCALPILGSHPEPRFRGYRSCVCVCAFQIWGFVFLWEGAVCSVYPAILGPQSHPKSQNHPPGPRQGTAFLRRSNSIWAPVVKDGGGGGVAM